MAHALRHLIHFARGFAAALALAGFSRGLVAETPPAPEQSVHFTVFAAKPVQNLSYLPLLRGAPVKLVFYPTARSPRYEFRGAMPARFIDAATGNVFAEATIPPEIRDALLLFAPVEPAPASGLRYQVSVLDDGAARHGRGGLAMINFSGLELRGTVGPQNVILKAGLNPTLPIGRTAKIILRTSAKGRSYQAYADTVELAPAQRALLILFPPFYQGSLEVQSRLLIDEPPRAPRASK
ncbi:MAG TPA: hypothetical protein VHD62_04845 [Opitutaceae bacterium]|nr:hypothetical protein [Opitutaceae bacterium]